MLSILAAFAIWSSSAFAAEENPLAAHLISDAEITKRCQASIRARTSVVDGKTECERIYLRLRGLAEQYQAELEHERTLVAEQKKGCGDEANQASCLAANKELSEKMAKIHRHLADLADQAQKETEELGS